jgi:hypothetical protein
VGEPRRGLLILLPLLQTPTHSNGSTGRNIACTSDVCPKEDFVCRVVYGGEVKLQRLRE